MTKGEVKDRARVALQASRRWFRGKDENGNLRKPPELIQLRQRLINMMPSRGHAIPEDKVGRIHNATTAILNWGRERGLALHADGPLHP